ncbi:(Na+)-NQR maturation NqrM [Pseudomonas sp. BMS12]|uniref:(Na+)-NQR maturation NqrM n=1 Tax=Pseudomonas sp. BMS12 TaxID=1796033 RepID=UPI00083B502E|nr:(Na+)-NQR maturation NqrM [Pseudomonas sp. BMS12]
MTWVLVFGLMLLVVLGMAVGVIFGRKPIAGSCGGIANLGIEKECSICGGSREKCEEVNREQNGDVVDATLAYDATKR